MLFAWCARSFLGELGDKTFLLAVASTVWCPYEGVRAGSDSLFQQLLVFLAVLSSLWARNLMLLSSDEPTFYDGHFESASCILFLLMIPRAYWDFRESDSQDQKRRVLVAAATKRAASGPKSIEGPQGIFAIPQTSPFSPKGDSEWQEDPSYGAIAPSDSAGGIFSEKISDQLTASLFAFIVPALLVFAAEAEDKSAAVTLAAGKPETNGEILCALLGIVAVVAFAVLLGFVLERQVSDCRLTFGVLAIFSTLLLVSLSQALLHLEVFLDANTGGSVQASLLSILRAHIGNVAAFTS